jgi:hypothetical protein
MYQSDRKSWRSSPDAAWASSDEIQLQIFCIKPSPAKSTQLSTNRARRSRRSASAILKRKCSVRRGGKSLTLDAAT